MPRPARLVLAAALALTATACGDHARPAAPAAAAAAAAPAAAAAAAAPAAAAAASVPALPPGVLAREAGLQGELLVVERDGLRQLVIDGAVHAAMPLAGAPASRDAMAGLLRAVRPAAKTALVIGLGSGETASQLAAAGLDVLAVELEPKVVDLARRFFGFRGKAEVADGLAFVRRDPRTWDVILVDALAPRGLPAPFLEPAAITALRARLSRDGGVLAVRMVEAPQAPAAAAFLERIGDHRFHLALGSGVGDEPQNLYLLDSDRPLSLDADPALPLWPLIVPGRTAQRVPTSRDVTLLGYLVRVGPQRTLCLDLLHWEMGAVRFVLGGAAASQLEQLAPQRESPSDGDIGTDGPLGNTLADALGGAHFKRSDIRYSPTIVALRGTARFRRALDADDLEMLREARRQQPPAQPPQPPQPPQPQPLLPWGGVLYDLDVTAVPWKLDLAGWRALRAKHLAPRVKLLHAAARAGDLAAAYAAATTYVVALDTELGAWAPQFEVHRHMRFVRNVLLLDSKIDARSPAAERGAACIRAADEIDRLPRNGGYFQNPDTDPLPDLLRQCAKAAAGARSR
jgi:hypothetical protein